MQGAAVLAISLAVYAIAAWTSAAVRPIGDEPQYLIITQSLLIDGDLQIENNHAREDYAAYHNAPLKPDYLRRGKNGAIYSIHAPGLAALVAPAFAVRGYPGVVVFLVFVSALGAWLVWRTAFTLTGSAGAAWFGWASVCLSVPFLCHSGAVFPDGPGAVLVMTGVAALLRLEKMSGTTFPSETMSGTMFHQIIRENGSRHLCENGSRHLLWAAQGVALAALPWLHTRFAAAAAVLGVCIALRLIALRRTADLAAFAFVPAVSAAAWFGFFHAIYGTYSPAAPYRSMSDTSLGNLWPGLPGLLLDQQYGLLPNAPVYAIALAGLALLFRSHRRLAIELSVLLLVYLAAVASYTMWWGGWSAPARFAVPVLLTLGPCAALFWSRQGVTGRAAGAVLLGVSLAASAIAALVNGGRLMLNSRDGIARWLEWLCPVVDLPRGLPSFFWRAPWQTIGDAAIWVAVLAGAWVALRFVVRGGWLPTATLLLFAGGVMVATTIVWRVHGEAAVTPTSGQLWLMDRFDPQAQPVGVQYRPVGMRPSLQLVERLRISASERRRQASNSPPLSVRDLPAGTYRVVRSFTPNRPSDLQIVVNKSPLTLRDCAFDDPPPADCLVRLPVDLVEIKITTGDRRLTPADARRVLALQPVEPLPPGERPTRLKAMMAASYGRFSAFAFDERVFLEPAGLWVEGGAEVPLVLASRERQAAMTVLLRNGARANTVHLRGALTLDFALAPAEERMLTIPLGAASRAAFLTVRADHGFRPSEVDAGSRDERYPGAWLETAEGR